VVGVADERWGEVPVAHVVLRAGWSADPEDLTTFLRGRIAGFKVPRRFVFGDIPKTSTGKVQKHVLRSRLSAVSPGIELRE
jgi:fatty-acyl-CoA synthase